jgi:hypothetical protein
MDISNNIPNYFNNNWKDFFKPSDTVIKYEMKQNGVPLITGIEAKRKTTKTRQPNMTFKAYDKRIPNPNQPNSRENCLKRFGEIDIVRREWVLKSRWLKSTLLNSPTDAFQTIMTEYSLKQVLRKMRKTRDLIFYKTPKNYKKRWNTPLLRKDTFHYLSLHSDEANYYKKHFHSDLSVTEIKKMLNKKPNVFLKNHRASEYITIQYNPYKQMKGLSKHFSNMSWEETYDLLDLQIKHLHNSKFIKPTTSYDSDAEYQDYLIKLTGSFEDLKNFIIKEYEPKLSKIDNNIICTSLALEEPKKQKFDKRKQLSRRWVRDGYGLDKAPPKTISIKPQNDATNNQTKQLSIEDIKNKYLILPSLRRGKKE